MLACLAPDAFTLDAAVAQVSDSDSVTVSIVITAQAEIVFPEGFDFYLHVSDKKHHRIEPAIIPFKIRGNARASVTAIPDDFLRVYRGPWLGRAERVGAGGDHHHWDWDGWDHWGWHDWGRNGHFDGHGSHGGHGGHDDPFGPGWRDGHDDHHDKGWSHGHHGHPSSGPSSLGYNAIVRFPVNSWRELAEPPWRGFATGIYGGGLASLPGQKNVGTPLLTANVAGRAPGRLGVIFIVSERDWTESGRDAEPGKYRGIVEVTVTAEDP